MNSTKLTRILSIDGGGIRGILPGQILVSLEKKLQAKTNNPDARLADFFDLMAGTSTGGILCCIYLTPGENDRPRFSAEDAVNLYLENGQTIFKQTFFNMGGLLNKKYPHKPIEQTLENYLGAIRLSDLLKECLITSYDIERGHPLFFKRHRALNNPGYDFLVKDIARATSAAPTYFQPHLATSFEEVKYALIDGGVFVNNPALCAYSEARLLEFDTKTKAPKAANMLLVSIGTGSTRNAYQYRKAQKWGAIRWVKPLLDMMMKGVAQTVDYQLTQIFDAAGVPHQYHRIEPTLVHGSSYMDDCHPENLANLKADGNESALNQEVQIDHIADLLIQHQ